MPNTDDIIALHKKYAPSNEAYDMVYNHCRAVRDIALQLIDSNHLTVDRDLVETGSMLHDIGVYLFFDQQGKLILGKKSVPHATECERILREEGFPEKICRIASHHTGVGLTKQDVIDQGHFLPAADYLAESDEELLIMYADKFHTKAYPSFFKSFDSYRTSVAKFGADKAAKFDEMAAKFGKPDLAPLSRAYSLDIR